MSETLSPNEPPTEVPTAPPFLGVTTRRISVVRRNAKVGDNAPVPQVLPQER